MNAEKLLAYTAFPIVVMLWLYVLFTGYKEPVQCVVSSLPTVHGEKLNKIDLTLKCGEDIIQITDQQIGYSFSESGVKKSGKPSPQTIINE